MFSTAWHDVTPSWTSPAQDPTLMEGRLTSSTPYDSDCFPVAETVPYNARQEADVAEFSVSHETYRSEPLSILMQRSHSTRSSTSNASSSGHPPTYAPEILYCEIQDCTQSFTGTYRRGNLGRHRRLVHGTGKAYMCEDKTCAKEFRRQDARLKHYRKYHPELAASNPYVRRSSVSRSTRRNLEVELSNMSPWAR